MKIAVVDDQEESISFITSIIKLINPIYEVETYIDSASFLKNASRYDLVFLDIDMPFIDGIEVSHLLHDLEVHIVFVTSHSERMIEAFGKNVIGFIEKETSEQGIRKLFHKIADTKQYIVLKQGYQNVKIYVDEIEYISYFLRDITFHLLNQKDVVIKKMSLKDILQKLSEDFILVSRSNIVNSKYMLEMKDDMVILNNKQIKVSRRNKKKVQMKIYEKRLAYARNLKL